MHDFRFNKKPVKKHNCLNNPNKRLWMGYWVITSTIIILSLSQVLISSNIATMGADLAKIQKTTVVFEESNSVLGAKLDRYHSLLNVSENGSINGFIETTSKIVFGSTKVPVALR